MIKAFIMLPLLTICAFGSQRNLSDFALHSGKYLVISHPVTIAKGDTVTVSAGSDILFASLAGITISDGGVLQAFGSKDKPVVFSSVLDTAHSASPFDWNGIDIKKGGNAALSYSFLAYSSSGISVDDSSGITLDNCIFSDNGQWHFAISGIIMAVPDMKSFSFAGLAKPLLLPTASPLIVPVDTNSHVIAVPSHRPILKTHTLILGGAGIALAVLGCTALVYADKYHSEYYSYVPGNPSFDADSRVERQRKFDELRSKYEWSTAAGWTGLAFAALDGAFLVYSFKF